MDLEIITIVVAIISIVSTTLTGLFIHISNKRDKQREAREKEVKERQELLIESLRKDTRASVDNAVATGKSMVSSLSQRADNIEKYNTEKFKSITEEQVRQSKEIRTLQAQHVTEHKVDSKLAPITKEIAAVKQENKGTREEMRTGFKEIREYQTLLDMNIQNIGKDVSETKGYLRHWAETSKRDD